ncbi:hypothetical protein BDU57DRAFT_441267 [Ampelomyces quisqualis]|uniref:Transcription factor TFIIIC triple barrel domain-containing protein n=1 Tax=Ampelomyces quisqualis TaxID=50730 RepID=A0A6A5QWY5_AMPQU|nr:hypothetical protein BDU57DRAFT_441267 [Ampelomyces quisqualis]
MAPEEDEWEYEYHENETEEFFIPIDLSNVPSAQIPTNSERRAGHPTLLKSRLRALHATRGQLPELQADGLSTQEPATMGELQITGLHTSNPLIMYNEQLLSCHWTSTIGTDMFFTKPQAHSNDSHQPLRSLPSVDLLSLGTAKLVAKVGRLRPRDDLFEDDRGEQPDSVGVQGTGSRTEETSAPSQSVLTDKPATNAGAAPTDFLARLNEAKARRGETTRLAVRQTQEGSQLVSELITTAARTGNDCSSQQTEDVTMGGA